MGRETRTYVYRSLGFFVVLELMLVAAILYWPNFMENVDSLKKLAAPMPMLSQMVTKLEEGGVSAYVVGQHFFKGCNTLGAAAAVLFAMGAVAGEAHRGTLELWLARPVSRTRLLTERYVGGLVATTLPVFLTSLTVPALLAQVDETMGLGDLLRCSVHHSAFLAMLYSLTFLMSAATSHPTRIAFIMLFFNIFEFAIYMVKEITHYSIFRMTDIEVFMNIASQDRMPLGFLSVLVVLSAACYVGSLALFQRRVP